MEVAGHLGTLLGLAQRKRWRLGMVDWVGVTEEVAGWHLCDGGLVLYLDCCGDYIYLQNV